MAKTALVAGGAAVVSGGGVGPSLLPESVV